MSDYTTYAVFEAAQHQIAIDFINAIKQMDSELAKKRLACLLKSNPLDADFISVASQFTSLIGHNTNVD
jgi:hypothetical protein